MRNVLRVTALIFLATACTGGSDVGPALTLGSAASGPTGPTTEPTTAVPVTEVPTTEPTTTDAPRPAIEAPPGYTLVWNDEFETDRLNLSKWRIEHSTFGDGGNTLHCYVPELVSVRNDYLVLTGTERSTTCPNGQTRRFASGMVTTEGLADFQYGWFEIRARIPEGQGLWPALWMSPSLDRYGTWPASGELDIMEARGQEPDHVRLNLHWMSTDGGRAQASHDQQTAPGTSFSDRFHTFAMRWEPDRITWMIDGLDVHRVTDWPSAVGPPPAPFDEPFFFRVNLAIGGDFTGEPDATTAWPAEFEVDYVRVFQQL